MTDPEFERATATLVVWVGPGPPPPELANTATVLTRCRPTARAMVGLARQLRSDAAARGRFDIVRGSTAPLWTSAVFLGAVLGAAVVCDVDSSLEARRAVASWPMRLLLRVCKPVMVAENPPMRAELPTSVPSVLARDFELATQTDPSTRRRQLYRRIAGSGRAPRFLAVNARHEGRPTTGVERYAQEITKNLAAPIARFAPPARMTRGPLGHAWEQVVLPLRTLPYRCHLFDLCNFGPVVMRRQTVVIHDLAPIDHPEWFSTMYRAWYRVVARGLYRRAEQVVTDSRFTRERLERHWGVRRKVSVVPLGVSEDFGTASETPEPSPSDRYVCFVGSIEPRKNLATLLDAMELARRVDPELKLVVVGGLGARRVFGDRPTALDVAWIRHVERASDSELRTLVASAACLVYPSLYEGFGLPPLEAMALGTPVVVSDIPVMHEVCGDAALFADPTSARDIADAIRNVVSLSREERDERVGRGRRRADTFRWSVAARRLEELIWERSAHALVTDVFQPQDS